MHLANWQIKERAKQQTLDIWHTAQSRQTRTAQTQIFRKRATHVTLTKFGIPSNISKTSKAILEIWHVDAYG